MSKNNNIVAIGARRKQKALLDRKASMSNEQRIRELEEDMLRVIEMELEMNSRLESLQITVNQIFRLLRKARRNTNTDE